MSELHINNLNNAELERLSLLIEEASEVIAIATKILRFGYCSSHPKVPNVSNKQLLEIELGHLMARVELLVKSFDVDEDSMTTSAIKKLDSQEYLIYNKVKE